VDRLSDDEKYEIDLMNRESCKRDKNERRKCRFDSTIKILQANPTIEDIVFIINNELFWEVHGGYDLLSLWKNVDEEINYVISKYNIQNFKCYKGKLYSKYDISEIYPMFKTKYSEQTHGMYNFVEPKIISIVDSKLKFDEIEIYVKDCIVRDRLACIDAKIEEANNLLKELNIEKQKIYDF